MQSRWALLATGVVLWTVLAMLTGGAGVAPPPRVPTAKDRCAVCGMLVALYPEWLAQLSFEDDSVAFFDGAKDLFTYLNNRDSYLPGKREMKITSIYVIDYYSAKAIPAESALFVVGSDVLGPMGHELVAHAERTAAEEFCRDHHGTSVLSFAEVDAAILDTLR